MKWKELSGPDRYQAIRMLMEGTVSMAELSRTFEVSRQTLSRARELAEQAAMDALEPKQPGRKGKSDTDRQIEALQQTAAQLRKDLALEKKKVQIAQAFLDLERRMERGEPLVGEGKKKNRDKRRRRAARRKPKTQTRPRLPGNPKGMAEKTDGVVSGNDPAGAGALAAEKTGD